MQMRIEILEPKKPLFWPSRSKSGVDTLTPCCLRLLSFYQELFQTDVHVLKRREWLFFGISRQIWPDRPDTAGLPAGYQLQLTYCRLRHWNLPVTWLWGKIIHVATDLLPIAASYPLPILQSKGIFYCWQNITKHKQPPAHHGCRWLFILAWSIKNCRVQWFPITRQL